MHSTSLMFKPCAQPIGVPLLYALLRGWLGLKPPSCHGPDITCPSGASPGSLGESDRAHHGRPDRTERRDCLPIRCDALLFCRAGHLCSAAEAGYRWATRRTRAFASPSTMLCRLGVQGGPILGVKHLCAFLQSAARISSARIRFERHTGTVGDDGGPRYEKTGARHVRTNGLC